MSRPGLTPFITPRTSAPNSSSLVPTITVWPLPLHPGPDVVDVPVELRVGLAGEGRGADAALAGGTARARAGARAIGSRYERIEGTSPGRGAVDLGAIGGPGMDRARRDSQSQRRGSPAAEERVGESWAVLGSLGRAGRSPRAWLLLEHPVFINPTIGRIHRPPPCQRIGSRVSIVAIVIMADGHQPGPWPFSPDVRAFLASSWRISSRSRRISSCAAGGRSGGGRSSRTSPGSSRTKIRSEDGEPDPHERRGLAFGFPSRGGIPEPTKTPDSQQAEDDDQAEGPAPVLMGEVVGRPPGRGRDSSDREPGGRSTRASRGGP